VGDVFENIEVTISYQQWVSRQEDAICLTEYPIDIGDFEQKEVWSQ